MLSTGAGEIIMAKQYQFKIEGETYHWDEQFITGAQVRQVGPGIPEGMDLYVKVRNLPGRPVADDEKIDLAEPGIEKFYAQDASSEAGNS
jgi:hypothetical protein